MNKTQAIEILSNHFGGSYLGTFVVPAVSPTLVESIMWEGDEGKTFHQWDCGNMPKHMVEESNLIGLAKHYA